VSVTPKKREIYENGIDLGLRFIEWKEVTGYEWKDGFLRLKFKGLPKEMVLKDKDGSVKEIVKNKYGKKV
jgi:hypothetical protein